MLRRSRLKMLFIYIKEVVKFLKISDVNTSGQVSNSFAEIPPF